MTSIEDIKNEINQEADKYVELNELQTNTSYISFWKFVKHVFAFSRYNLELILNQHKQEVADMISNDYAVGTEDFLAAKALDFQYGDKLYVNEDNTLQYKKIDPSKRIISRRSVKTALGGGIDIKVNKGVPGNLGALSEAEIGAFEAYISRVKMAGSKVNVYSYNANKINLSAIVQIEKEVFRENGQRIEDEQYSVLEALRNFINYVGYDEVVYVSDMIKHVLEVEGVRSFFVTSIKIDAVEENITDGKFVMSAGYGVIDFSDEDFNKNITYEFV